ncbi:hypothetical protein CONPUDRAFT_148289 [Coniophora puteana RWD-64-598 SS2]|uniref:DUF6533 domain-containing protein n=1 Tax=Coniophora puteana (strain RWD-64-598) TaxID=741705 RepID=A0A5M3N4K7_CONPW|nr:uncharacterized protein CONPUDRAFT_148289 [Coniophora puteana RWD-64-598 SS2]EIW86187.1 hypothetical protein CONPUDRAFT_148289 [Coniophora puteana RWD-64-598 SS2]
MSLHLSYETLVIAVRQKQLYQYLAASTASVLVFDTLSSLDEEIKYVWKSRWHPVKVLYLWTRYQNLAIAAMELWFLAFPGGPSGPACYKPMSATICTSFFYSMYAYLTN